MTTILIRHAGNTFIVSLSGTDPPALQEAVDSLKRLISRAQRRFNAERREWSIHKSAAFQFYRWVDYACTATGANIEWGPVAGSVARRETRPADPYSVLHLRETAPPELIKAAYRTLAQLYHPDRGGDAQVMTELNLAYELLTKRAA